MPHWGLCVGCVGLRLSKERGRAGGQRGRRGGASKGSCHINNLHASAPGRVAAIVVVLIVAVVVVVAIATADIILYIYYTHTHTDTHVFSFCFIFLVFWATGNKQKQTKL